MDLAGRTRNTAATAALAGVVGFTVTLHGAYRNQPAHSLAGVCITMIALTALILIAIHKWTTDTSTERTILAATQREAQSRKDQYLAAQAALEIEQGRLARDMAAARRRTAADLIKEREALRAEFEEKRANLISETMEATVLMFRDGKFAPDTTTATGRLIRFPDQSQPARATEPERARSQEHGVVGP